MTGPSGVRKTCISKFVTERLREKVLDEEASRDRVVLAHESVESYAAEYYETQLIRAVESVLSPLGWDRTAITEALSETEATTLADFSD